MVTTNSDELANRLRRFRNHCIVKQPTRGSWYYEIEGIGYNYRLSDIHAALGASQVAKVDAFISRRAELADRYRDLLRDTDVQLPPEPAQGFTHAYHLFPIRVQNRRAVVEYLQERGVGVQVHYVPLYRHPLYRRDPLSFPETEYAYDRLISLPLFPRLDYRQQSFVADTLKMALDTTRRA